MSYSIDANLLLYASAGASPFHARASEFLRRCQRGPELLVLAWPTLMAYLRLSTNPAILSPPLTPEQANENVGALLARPHVRVVAEETGFWQLYRESTRDVVVRGNLVTDAHLAALLRQQGVETLYTNDRDFRRFEFLRLLNPLDGPAGS